MANFIPRIKYDATYSTTIAFDYPPEGDPWGETERTIGTRTTSASGVIQYNQTYLEKIFKVKLRMVSSTDVTAFKTFFESWASLKKDFKWYPHTDVDTGMIVVTLEDEAIEYKRILPDGSGDFLYEFGFSMRLIV